MGNPEELTGAEIVIRALVDRDVDTVFGYPGGAVLPLYDALFKQNQLKHYLVRHEQGAVHMAEGYARSTGTIGAVIVTSGPGATNTVTGLADAYMDSIPLICVTGQVPTHMIGNDAFQEADITGITRSCTKHNYLVRDVNDLERIMHEAMTVATSGRPGPVLVDIPKNIFNSKVAYQGLKSAPRKSFKPRPKTDPKSIEAAVELMAKAKRPIFYTGGGVINAGPEASEKLRELVRLTGYPCTSTLMGLGAFPASDELFLGMLGMHGTYEANMAMYECDVMINLGARFDDRVTGRVEGFSPKSKKIHVDIDPSSINKNVVVDVAITGDAGEVIDAMLRVWKRKKYKANAEHLDKWWKRIEKWRARKCLEYKDKGKSIKPQYFLETLNGLIAKKDFFLATDVGQHQMWSAQFIKFDRPNRWLTSGGLGTMGYGMPAATGVQVAHPKKLVLCISGDGSIMMNIQELATIRQYRLPVKVIIMNNGYLGMVRQWQELFHGERYSESYFDSVPDFVKLAEACGIKGFRATKKDEVESVLKAAIAHDGPVVVDMVVEAQENVYPMIPAGANHNDIELGPGKDLELNEEKGMVLI
ncbi:MAG: biosynthetic-type acetolactate synthase large subunit [Alphaproteobacteria bacterium]|nr:biosynthetic-type acetolactate synthase large subunit [Alphaproteobacteria bacterium]